MCRCSSPPRAASPGCRGSGSPVDELPAVRLAPCASSSCRVCPSHASKGDEQRAFMPVTSKREAGRGGKPREGRRLIEKNFPGGDLLAQAGTGRRDHLEDGRRSFLVSSAEYAIPNGAGRGLRAHRKARCLAARGDVVECMVRARSHVDGRASSACSPVGSGTPGGCLRAVPGRWRMGTEMRIGVMSDHTICCGPGLELLAVARRSPRGTGRIGRSWSGFARSRRAAVAGQHGHRADRGGAAAGPCRRFDGLPFRRFPQREEIDPVGRGAEAARLRPLTTARDGVERRLPVL